MSHYDIDYSGLTPQQAHEKALQDIQDYMGSERYAKLTALLSADKPTSLEHFRITASFAGVQGYPVRAWHDAIWPYG